MAALFGVMLLVFFKRFPAVSLWEVAEGRVVCVSNFGTPQLSRKDRMKWT